MKFKISIGLFIIGLLLFGWVQFYYGPKMEAADEEERLAQLEPETHQFSSVLEYANPYMGSAGNNINLINGLPMSELPRKFEQFPEEFRFMVNYEVSTDEVDVERIEKAILYNATAVFVLIENMEIVDFNFIDQTYTVTRERVNDWFEEDVATFNTEKIFKEKVQQPIIQKERLTEWFAAYTGGEN